MLSSNQSPQLTSGNSAGSKAVDWAAMGFTPYLLQKLMGDPSKDAFKYFDQIPGTVSPYYNPYINAGHNSLDILQKQYGDLVNDPGSILAKLGKGYNESPGYQFERGQGLNSINNAAAAGGMLGTGQHQQQAGDLASQLANRDYGDYLKNAIGMYNTGLSGESDINQMGFNASDKLANMLAQILASKGQYAYESGAARNKNMSDWISGGMSMAGKGIFG